MVFQGLNRIGRRVGSQPENVKVRCLTLQSEFSFGDATGLCFSAADSNVRLDNQTPFNLVGDKCCSHCEVPRATVEFVETKSCGFWQQGNPCFCEQLILRKGC